MHILVGMIYICCTSEGVRTRLGYGVDTTANEVGLTNVKGSNNDLYLIDSVHRDGVTTTGELRAKTEVIVEVGTVQGEVRATTVTTCETHTIGIGRDTGDVADRAVNGRQLIHHLVRDVGGCTRLLSRKLRGLTCNYHLGQLVGVFSQPHLEIVSLTELECDTFQGLCLETDVAYRY